MDRSESPQGATRLGTAGHYEVKKDRRALSGPELALLMETSRVFDLRAGLGEIGKGTVATTPELQNEIKRLSPPIVSREEPEAGMLRGAGVDSAMMGKIGDIKVIFAATEVEKERLRNRERELRAALPQNLRSGYFMEAMFRLERAFEDALLESNALIPEDSGITKVLEDPIDMKALTKLLAVIDQQPQETAEIFQRIKNKTDSIQVGLQEHSRFHVSTYWEESNNLPLNDRIIYTFDAIETSVAQGLFQDYVEFFLDFAGKEHDARQAIMTTIVNYKDKLHQVATWWLMRKYPNVLAFRAYRGSDTVFTGSEIDFRDPAYFTFSEEYARNDYLAAGGQLLAADIPIEKIVYFDDLDTETNEIVVEEGVYPKATDTAMMGEESLVGVAQPYLDRIAAERQLAILAYPSHRRYWENHFVMNRWLIKQMAGISVPETGEALTEFERSRMQRVRFASPQVRNEQLLNLAQQERQ